MVKKGIDIFSGNFKLPNKQGLYNIKYDAVDNVENLSKNSYKTVIFRQ